ncbi:MAG: DNA polymerase III subunit beta, partial [Bacteroidales bacterium]|nr:DNA polymerase III subunit beta [Bacteroidales bacterium]
MKFVISSTELLSHLQVVSRVISSKNTLPILDNFLFKLGKNELEITASDLESTLITRIVLENASEEGSIAMPARIITDALKEFSEQPLTFEINLDSLAIVISSETGKFNIVGQNGSDFPQLPGLKDEQK